MQIKLNQIVPVVLFFFLMLFTSCEDDYKYDDKEPDFLGASIYEYLQKDGNFSYFLRLIDDVGYKEILLRTGSKTLFPVRDEGFESFFQKNPYGVSSYDELSAAQKREIMNTSMINMAYLSYMLANASDGEGLGEGRAIRRKASNTYLDSMGLFRDDLLLENPFWERFKTSGLYLVENYSDPTIVHITPENMALEGITAEDFSMLYNKEYTENGIYINGVEVVERDIICKNGYIHILKEVLVRIKNMDQIIRDNGATSLFSKLLNKFSYPLYSQDVSNNIHNFYDGSAPGRPEISPTDSVFIKCYYTEQEGEGVDPNGKKMKSYGLLYYNPADNAYSSTSPQQDMGTMFVPTDEAMNAYFYSEEGRYLRDAFGSWENVTTNLLAMFLKNHQKRSFLNSLYHRWPTMNDETSYFMGVDKADIDDVYVGGNGAVYVTNKVFPPVDFFSVYASALASKNSTIMSWGIMDEKNKFFLYLRSMENMYNLIVPTDDAFQNYRDPISWAVGAAPEIWSFRYMPDKDEVHADVYLADASGNKGAYLREVTDQATIKNRLFDIIDMHIVVGNKEGSHLSGYIDDGNTVYAKTKSGTSIKISGAGVNTKMTGGGDLELGITPAEIVNKVGMAEKAVYDSDNGRTYFVDRILQDPVKSVYGVLGEHPEYKAFFDLLQGNEQVFTYFQNDADVVPIFDTKRMSSSTGIGYVVYTFGNFQYTVFIPTEEAIKKVFAEDEKLFTWEEIAEEEDYDIKKERTLYLLNFLKYHFMDNSIFIDGKSSSGMRYETAARTEADRFYRVILNSTGENIQVFNENLTASANVIKSDGLYNVMARDYIVNNADPRSATQIVSSSRVVIHLIDNALRIAY